MKANYIKGSKILIILTCIILMSSCAFVSNCRYYTYAYYKPRLDKTPYATINIRKEYVGLPSLVSVNNYNIPDSVFKNYTNVYLEIYKHTSFFLIEMWDYKYTSTKYPGLVSDKLIFRGVDTITFEKMNKLKLNIKANNVSNQFDINLLKGRFIYIADSCTKDDGDIKLEIYQRVVGFLE